MSTEDTSALLRWRLALGSGAERADPQLRLDQLAPEAGSLDLDTESVQELDRALSFVYEEPTPGTASSRTYLPDWLRGLREFFAPDAVALIQKDAIERRGLTQLLFEPETLPLLEKNVELAATLIGAASMVPDEAKQLAREIVREIVEKLKKKLEPEIRTAIVGAVRRDRSSPTKSARNIDWQRTIRANLKGWDKEKRRLVPDRFHFFANQRRRHEWDVVLAVDQSGSMAESVVFAAITAAIFASLDVLRTRLIFFDTEIADMTPLLRDPVEVLFSAQLGGGTDIARAVAYASEELIERPEKTIFIVVSDLFEGGDRADLLARMRALVESKVKAMCVLALTDRGQPAHDHELAKELAAVGVHCFASTPQGLVERLERILRG
jgi:Mg-chelatase subunit ChlD